MPGGELCEFGLRNMQLGAQFARVGNTKCHVAGIEILARFDVARRDYAADRCTDAGVAVV